MASADIATERKKLIHAVESGNKKAVTHLLRIIPHTEATHQDVSTALGIAAGKGYLDIVKSLLAHGADINSTLEDDSTALHQAIKHGHLHVAHYLLEHGANVNAQCNDGSHPQVYATHGITPLHLACHNQDTNGIELLLSYGADPEAANTNGATPLSIAEHHQNKVIQDLLYQAKLNVFIHEQRKTPESIFNRFSFFGKPVHLSYSTSENLKAARELQKVWGHKKAIKKLPEEHPALEHGELGELYAAAAAARRK